MATEKAKVTYLELDPANWSNKQKIAGKKIEAAQALMKEATGAFLEASADRVQGYYDTIVSNKGVVQGTTPVISTRYGKVSVFFVGDKTARRSMKV